MNGVANPTTFSGPSAGVESVRQSKGAENNNHFRAVNSGRVNNKTVQGNNVGMLWNPQRAVGFVPKHGDITLVGVIFKDNMFHRRLACGLVCCMVGVNPEPVNLGKV